MTRHVPAHRLDWTRQERTGSSEAIYCEGKSLDQVGAIASDIAAGGVRTIFTRVDQDKADLIVGILPGAIHDPQTRLVWWPAEPPAPTGGLVVVAAAGTSDLPVALEAAQVAEFHGRRVEVVADVGVAGLHRILGTLDLLRSASVVVVVAGMDGALPSVVAGLVSCPVVAVPTSVGYGAAFEGLAALLAMLNSCAPGVAVVNIDNGFGAGLMAARIGGQVTPPAAPGPRPPR